MAVCFEETLQKKLNEILASVQQEEQRLKAERQAIEADRTAMEAELKSKTAQLEEERAAFEAEKEIIVAANNAAKSKVKLDVGGTIYHASRMTLTSVPGSMLEAMFSGRHELKEDEDGRVFIDRDGATFKLILEYLRSPAHFSLDGLSKREVASCEAEFDFYGLPPPVPPAPPLCLRTNTDPSGLVRAELQYDNCCTISRGTFGIGRWAWALGVEVLANDAMWKIHVQQLSGCYDPMMGIIANPTPSSGNAHGDATFACWYDPNHFHVHGGHQCSPGWPGWQQNDEAIFKLNAPAHTLTVHLKRTGQCYTFSDLPAGKVGQWRFCIDMRSPTKVVLSCPTDDERVLVQ